MTDKYFGDGSSTNGTSSGDHSVSFTTGTDIPRRTDIRTIIFFIQGDINTSSIRNFLLEKKNTGSCIRVIILTSLCERYFVTYSVRESKSSVTQFQMFQQRIQRNAVQFRTPRTVEISMRFGLLTTIIAIQKLVNDLKILRRRR